MGGEKETDETSVLTLTTSNSSRHENAHATQADHRTAAASLMTSRRVPIRDLGKTTVFASRRDPRFSYCLYVPPDFTTTDTAPELIVVVHDSSRSFLDYRDALAEFGRWNNVSYPYASQA